jgi:ABC-type transporter Mla maintaining outer membrane lipid asymmetry ATPase subunit MlaF
LHVPEPVVDISSVSKQYGALRPLRVERLRMMAGEQLAVLGLDQPAAEVFISLLTGAVLPDTGWISVFGQATSDIANSDAWLASLDRFGIVSDRAAILESLTVVQNLAMPFTLDIEPPPDDVKTRAEGLAHEAGIDEASWHRPCHGLSAGDRLRLRLARALALDPALLVLEHPSASLERGDVASVARAARAIVERRQVTTLMLTMDREWASAAAGKMLTLEPATGRLKEGLLSRMGFRS